MAGSMIPILNPALQKTLPRAHGKIELGFDKTGLRHLFQSGCAKLLLPRVYGDVPEAVIVNTAGGMTGGDSLDTEINVGADTSLCLTSQTAERIYKSAEGTACVTNTIELNENSSLDWLPQETILFDNCAFSRKFDVSMAADARLLAVEPLVFGRVAMGESLNQARVHDSWRIRRGGKMIVADSFAFLDPVSVTRSKACLFGAKSLANVLYVAPDAEQKLGAVRDMLGRMDIEGAASAWNGILSIRLVAQNVQVLRKSLISFLIDFRGGKMPRVWHM